MSSTDELKLIQRGRLKLHPTCNLWGMSWAAKSMSEQSMKLDVRFPAIQHPANISYIYLHPPGNCVYADYMVRVIFVLWRDQRITADAIKLHTLISL